jgi:hypothetical protein
VLQLSTHNCCISDLVCKRALLCFIGRMATELVAVNMFSGKSVSSWRQRLEWCHAHGSSSLTKSCQRAWKLHLALALAFQADDNYVWAVFEKDMSAVQGARARVLTSKRNDGPMEDISPAPGVGVTVYDRLSHAITVPFNT